MVVILETCSKETGDVLHASRSIKHVSIKNHPSIPPRAYTWRCFISRKIKPPPSQNHAKSQRKEFVRFPSSLIVPVSCRHLNQPILFPLDFLFISTIWRIKWWYSLHFNTSEHLVVPLVFSHLTSEIWYILFCIIKAENSQSEAGYLEWAIRGRLSGFQ